MKSRIALMSYSKLTKVIKTTITPKELRKITIIESSFSKTKEIAINLWKKGKVDVFVCGGSNLQMIKDNIPAPIVPINISGFDIMDNLIKAKTMGNKIIIISYKSNIANKFVNKGIFNVDVNEKCYNDILELRSILNEIRKVKGSIVVGSSIVCDLCDEVGLDSVLVYSSDSIKIAIGQAIQIQESIQREKYKLNQFNAILNFTYSGIISTDRNNIIQIYNPMAENIIGIPRKEIVGKNANFAIENTRLSEVLISKKQEIDQLQKLNNKIILTSRVPILVGDKVEGVVATFRDVKSIEESEHKIRKQLYSKGLVSKYTFADIKGDSQVIKKCIEVAKEYANSNFTILISGESGTGKELFSHSIHNESERKNEAFVAINCAALPESLLESELFGYVGGAFTGAKKDGKVGLFELAHNGTIFLDEITEAPLSIQSRLLRVLQEREVMRLGSDRVIKINVRIISSTNKNLWKEVIRGDFREDLYYRLNALELKIPSLRERRRDIPIISREFIRSYFQNTYYAYKEKWEEIFNNLQKYEFYGNVRELYNVLKRLAIIIQKRGTCTAQYLIDLTYDEKEKLKIRRLEKKKKGEAEDIIEILDRNNWDKNKTAIELGISRTTLWRKMKIYGIE